MKRLYYLADSIQSLDETVEDLHEMGIEDQSLHVLGRDKQMIKDHKLHQATTFQELDISYSTIMGAALGLTIEMPTLEGKAKLKIPAGIQAGQVLRMRGKGFPKVRGSSRGDQLVRVHVQTPQSLSRKQKKLLEELLSLNGQSEPIFKRVELD
mgnify:CR=1 FL=1